MRPVIAATVIVLLAGTAAVHAGADRGDATLSEILPLHSDAAEQRGQIDLRDLDLNQPVLASSLQRLLAPPAKDAAAAAGADRQTVALRRLRLDFERSADSLIIRNGSVCSDAFAATIDGYARVPAGDLNFRGVVWFAMEAAPPLLRNPMQAIPIVGIYKSAGGWPGGISYQVTGASAAPLLRLNPFGDAYPSELRRVTEACGPPDPQRP